MSRVTQCNQCETTNEAPVQWWNLSLPDGMQGFVGGRDVDLCSRDCLVAWIEQNAWTAAEPPTKVKAKR